MKRLGLVLAGLALVGAVNTADAQLTMQMTQWLERHVCW